MDEPITPDVDAATPPAVQVKREVLSITNGTPPGDGVWERILRVTTATGQNAYLSWRSGKWVVVPAAGPIPPECTLKVG